MNRRHVDRIVIIVLDGVGVGALPDAADYGDEGAYTLGNLARAVGGLSLPALESLGLGAVAPVAGLRAGAAAGAFGRMAEVSSGKDSTTGHWELAGLETREPFPTFPRGFPPEVTDPLAKITGRPLLGNRPASGTDIIEEFGLRHLETGSPILYTSADSVLQLAAHDSVVDVERLYGFCRRARRLLDGMGLPVLRVIARPFAGDPGSFIRYGRKDFSLPPPEETVFDHLQKRRCPVLGIGKVGDLYGGRGLDVIWKTENNEEGLGAIGRALKSWPRGLVLANLIDFDTLHGHRNDRLGFAGALEEFDSRLGAEVMPALSDGDLLIVTADHGCDPTLASTDHTREYVPLLVGARALNRAVPLGTRETFADVAATVFDLLAGERWPRGRSFWPEIAPLWRATAGLSPGRP